MEISTEKIKAAYETASEEGKSLIRSMFPDVDLEIHIDDRPVTERIKTFDDACDALGADHPLVLELIDRACEWLKNEACKHIGFDAITEEFTWSWDLIEEFKKAIISDQ